MLFSYYPREFDDVFGLRFMSCFEDTQVLIHLSDHFIFYLSLNRAKEGFKNPILLAK